MVVRIIGKKIPYHLQESFGEEKRILVGMMVINAFAGVLGRDILGIVWWSKL